jgi:hypothetical protein
MICDVMMSSMEGLQHFSVFPALPHIHAHTRSTHFNIFPSFQHCLTYMHTQGVHTSTFFRLSSTASHTCTHKEYTLQHFSVGSSFIRSIPPHTHTHSTHTRHTLDTHSTHTDTHTDTHTHGPSPSARSVNTVKQNSYTNSHKSSCFITTL